MLQNTDKMRIFFSVLQSYFFRNILLNIIGLLICRPRVNLPELLHEANQCLLRKWVLKVDVSKKGGGRTSE